MKRKFCSFSKAVYTISTYEITEKFGDKSYCLRAVVNHLGVEVLRGHYLAYVSDKGSKNFWEVDDNIISGPEPIQKIPGNSSKRRSARSKFKNKNGDAYILLYELSGE